MTAREAQQVVNSLIAEEDIERELVVEGLEKAKEIIRKFVKVQGILKMKDMSGETKLFCIRDVYSGEDEE